jgi:hypothetical protein
MSDSAHPGTPLVGKLHRLLEISAEPYSSALVGTSFGRLDCLEGKKSLVINAAHFCTSAKPHQN